MARRSGVLFVVAALVAVLVAGVVHPSRVSATTRDGFEVTPDKGAGFDSGPLVGVNPQNEEDINQPSYCNSVTYCDTIPFTVTPPQGLGPDDTFYVHFVVSWDDPNKQDDVDVHVFDNGQLQGGTPTRLGKAATSNNPEKLDLQQPDLGEYQLVVTNASGVNNGYHVEAKMFRGHFESPVEQLAPPPASASNTTTTQAAPQDLSASPETTAAPAVTLAPVAVAHDDSLDFAASDFPAAVSGPRPEDFAAPAALRKAAKPKPVPAAVLVLWFVIVPVVLLGLAAGTVYRRRRSLLLAT